MPGIGVDPWSLAGVLAGKMAPKGTASWSRNSASACRRWKTTLLVLAFTTRPDRVQVAGVVTQAGPPAITSYQVPALGLETLKSRWKVALTSFTVTG